MGIQSGNDRICLVDISLVSGQRLTRRCESRFKAGIGDVFCILAFTIRRAFKIGQGFNAEYMGGSAQTPAVPGGNSDECTVPCGEVNNIRLGECSIGWCIYFVSLEVSWLFC